MIKLETFSPRMLEEPSTWLRVSEEVCANRKIEEWPDPRVLGATDSFPNRTSLRIADWIAAQY